MNARWQQFCARLPRSRRWLLGSVAAAALLLLLLAVCAGPAARFTRTRHGAEIEACGLLLPIGTPVVLWRDQGGYDAYQTRKHFDPAASDDGKLRYSPLRGNLPAALAQRVQDRGWTLADLQQVVHLLVLHFDAAGTSRHCFKILQDDRNLSVHFLLDVDGTIYQTLDLQAKAHHATIANDGSVGVEIANPGCWREPRHPDLLRWYERDASGWRMKFPGFLGDPGVRTPDFVPRPDRPEPIAGNVHGQQYWQFDYTPEQYRALAHLCAALHQLLPRIALAVPRDAAGGVRTTAMSSEQLHAFDGVVGHYHVQRDKQDPGPAMQWDRLLADARQLAGNP